MRVTAHQPAAHTPGELELASSKPGAPKPGTPKSRVRAPKLATPKLRALRLATSKPGAPKPGTSKPRVRAPKLRALRLGAAVTVAAAVLLTGCGSAGSGGDVSDAAVLTTATPKAATVLDNPFDKPDLVLTDSDGARYDLIKETAGKPLLLYFGYTHCPDVCPTTMSDIAIAKSRLPKAERQQLVVIMVTTDPARDTPARLKAWLGSMDTSFIGLTGDFAAIQAGARSVGIDVETPVKEKDGSIESTHGAEVLAYSPRDDKAHALYMSGTTADQYAADLPKIVKGQTP